MIRFHYSKFFFLPSRGQMAYKPEFKQKKMLSQLSRKLKFDGRSKVFLYTPFIKSLKWMQFSFSCLLSESNIALPYNIMSSLKYGRNGMAKQQKFSCVAGEAFKRRIINTTPTYPLNVCLFPIKRYLSKREPTHIS